MMSQHKSLLKVAVIVVTVKLAISCQREDILCQQQISVLTLITVISLAQLTIKLRTCSKTLMKN